ncbi:MAG: DNA-directed RNA polymerase subunit omega, partial [Alphaproteobacteria bacterium]|nr:DNA-directed RNA polymerase subunit omega [Alphaproteobacteria bacterium]
MARTTNSDTLPYVESRYELGMLATQRVRDLNGGAEPVVEKGNDKMTVVALREIASGKLDVNAVRHEFVQSYKESPALPDGEESLDGYNCRGRGHHRACDGGRGRLCTTGKVSRGAFYRGVGTEKRSVCYQSAGTGRKV